MSSVITSSAEETTDIGYRLGQQLSAGSVLCFYGDLAAGKTTLIKGLVAGATGLSKDQVCSPTFVYLNIYEGKQPIYHFDLYRLRDADEFLSMGFDEMLDGRGICCIEWAERIEPLIPENCIEIHMEHQGNDLRKVTIKRKNENTLSL